MRKVILGVIALSCVAGAAYAARGGGGPRTGVAVHGHGAYTGVSPAGQPGFREGGYPTFDGRPDGGWGFADGPASGGFEGRGGGHHPGRNRQAAGYGLYPYGFGDYGYGFGDAGYGQAPYVAGYGYGDAAFDPGPMVPPYTPALALGRYGQGSAYRGTIYVSGQGVYAYGYPGYATTPPIP